MLPKFLKRKTKIGVVGFPRDKKILFEATARHVENERDCRIELIWLAGVNGTEVHGRIVNKDSASKGKCSVEEEITIDGISTANDCEQIRSALDKVVDRVS